MQPDEVPELHSGEPVRLTRRSQASNPIEDPIASNFFIKNFSGSGRTNPSTQLPDRSRSLRLQKNIASPRSTTKPTCCRYRLNASSHLASGPCNSLKRYSDCGWDVTARVGCTLRAQSSSELSESTLSDTRPNRCVGFMSDEKKFTHSIGACGSKLCDVSRRALDSRFVTSLGRRHILQTQTRSAISTRHLTVIGPRYRTRLALATRVSGVGRPTRTWRSSWMGAFVSQA